MKRRLFTGLMTLGLCLSLAIPAFASSSSAHDGGGSNNLNTGDANAFPEMKFPPCNH